MIAIWNVWPVQLVLVMPAGVTCKACGTGEQSTREVVDCWGELESRKVKVVVPLPAVSPVSSVEPPVVVTEEGFTLEPGALETTE